MPKIPEVALGGGRVRPAHELPVCPGGRGDHAGEVDREHRRRLLPGDLEGPPRREALAAAEAPEVGQVLGLHPVGQGRHQVGHEVFHRGQPAQHRMGYPRAAAAHPVR